MPETSAQTQRRGVLGRSAPGTVAVVVDGSAAAGGAVRWAAAYARRAETRLLLIHATAGRGVALTPLRAVRRGGPSGRPGEDPAHHVLAAATAQARSVAPQVPVSGRIVRGGGVDALAGAATGSRLLVVGSRTADRRTGPLTGAAELRIAARTRCPAVVVCGAGEPGGPIAVAVDLAEGTEPALRFAFPEAARRGVTLIAVHVWTPPGGPDRQAPAVELRRAAGRSLTEALSPWRERFPAARVRELVLDGNATRSLPQSTAGAELAVVSVCGRHRPGFSRPGAPSLSPTSHAMLAGAACPVVVTGNRVRHDG